MQIMKKTHFSYENGLLILMCITFGLVFFDRFALVYLSPFIVKDLGLNNTQIGVLVGSLSLAWAISGYFTTAWAEANNHKKTVFLVSTVLFSVCSIFSGFAASFSVLLLSRLLMGFFEGPTLPLIQSFIAKESSPNRIGFNMGALQSFGSTLFGFIVAPVLLVVLAEKFGWRSVFFIAGLPGLLTALLNWKFIRQTTAETPKLTTETTLSLGELWQIRNIKVAVFISCCAMAWLTSCMTFMPQFFVQAQGLTEGEMGKFMGLTGVSSFFSGLIVSILADKFGKRIVSIIFLFVGIFFPLSVILLQNSSFQLPAMFLTNFMFGTFPIIFASIPSKSVPRHSIGKAIGLVVGSGELVGGVMTPFIAGILADKFGLQAPFWLASGIALTAFFASFYLMRTKEIEQKFNAEKSLAS
jgi:MFS family permease